MKENKIEREIKTSWYKDEYWLGRDLVTLKRIMLIITISEVLALGFYIFAKITYDDTYVMLATGALIFVNISFLIALFRVTKATPAYSSIEIREEYIELVSKCGKHRDILYYLPLTTVGRGIGADKYMCFIFDGEVITKLGYMKDEDYTWLKDWVEERLVRGYEYR